MKKHLPLSYIELSKKNLIHNIKQFRSFVSRDTKIACVVKANAYGHGDIEVVKILNSHVDYFQINSIEELEKIKKYTKKPILVLGYVGLGDIKKAIELGCILSVFDFSHAMFINESARKLGKVQKVHVAIDSHLGREGVMPIDVEKFAKEIYKMKNLKVDGIYSHFANIEDTNDFSHAQKQIDTYKKVVEEFKKVGFKDVKTHISATSGVMVYDKNLNENSIVRIGIGAYGIWPSEDLRKSFEKKIKLLPVLSYITHIAEVKELPAGETIGYGLTYKTKTKTKIAVIPQGYSNGLTRHMSNNGFMLTKGIRAKILGRVAMNMFVVDISKIVDIKAGDKVTIIGKNGEDEITAEEIAKWQDTLNYEAVTRLSPLLPRIVM